MKRHGYLFTTSMLISNLILSIVIVLLNKWIYQEIGFPNMTLTFVHFVMTSLGLVICVRLNVFNVKTLPIDGMLPLAVTFCGFVVLTNLSLGYNTVGTYQIMKNLTMPTIMVIQTVSYNKRFSTKIKLTLIPVSLGVILNSYYDIKFNIAGTLYALAGVLVTSLYQVWVGEKQREFQVNGMQLLYYQAPLSALLLFVIIMILENPLTYLHRHWAVSDLIMVVLSGIVAFNINLTIFWIIGETSAVTYNMVGQLKFCLTLVGGYILFQDVIHSLQLLGIIITIIGILLYTYIKLEEESCKTSLPVAKKTLRT